MRVRRLVGVLVLLLATPVSGADPRLDPARVEVFHEWFEHGNGEISPTSPSPAYCVGEGGWVLVDEAVAVGRVHVFVGFEGHGPFAARVRAHDEETGLALLSVHPAALAGRVCLTPSSEGTPPAEVPPVAGTPVLDDVARWVGVGAAGHWDEKLGKFATGEWVAQEHLRRAMQVAPVAVVAGLLARAGEGDERPRQVPPGEPLFQASELVYPRSLRERAAPPMEELWRYEASSEDGVRIEMLTPASLDTLARNADGARVGAGEFFRWVDHVAMWEPAVVVQLAPDFHWTAGSRAAAVTATLLFVPMVLGGGPPITFRAAYTSGKERLAFRVERGSETVEPMETFVSCFEEPMTVRREEGGEPKLRVVRGCRTFALFDPGAFAPGEDVEVEVTEADGDARCVPIAPATLERLAADFEPWREAIREGVPPTAPPRFRVPPPWTVSMFPAPQGWIVRMGFRDGSFFDLLRQEREGAPVVLAPVWRKHMAFWNKNANPPGWLEVSAEGFVFTPNDEALRAGGTVRVPRGGTSATREAWGVLRLSREDGSWTFVPRLAGEEAAGLMTLPQRSERVPATDLILRSLPPEKPVVEAP